jgi:actin-related protein
VWSWSWSLLLTPVLSCSLCKPPHYHYTIVTDPEAHPHRLHHTLHTSHPLLLTEPAWNTRQARELLAEVAFEGEGVPGVYIACSSVLSA